MNEKKQIHVWILEEKYEKIVQYAKENKRSIANAAEFLLEDAIDERCK